MGQDIQKILDLLAGDSGWPEPRRLGDPLSVLVQTILSQNTSDVNSGRAFRSLRAAFPTWEEVAAAPVRKIADAIRPGGLGEIKSVRIQQALHDIKERRGRLELDFLGALTLEEARGWLKSLSGVGDKTANVVLLFALGMPALPVDTHVFRVSKRLGLIPAKSNVEQAHRLLEKMVPADSVHAFHLLLIWHGRRTCKALRPLCPGCVLRAICPSFSVFYPELARNPAPEKAGA